MDLLSFFEQFPDEASCERYLIEKRWPDGYHCPHCGHEKAWYLKARRSFECSQCHRQFSITSGTVFHRSKVPLREWFLAMHLIATSKKGMSTLALQRQLPAHDEMTIALLKRKLRAAMQAREGLYQLGGLVEVDDAFFGGLLREGSRGRGSENKVKVLASVDFGRNEDDPRFCKLHVVERLNSAHVEAALEKAVVQGSTVKTDGARFFSGLGLKGFIHHSLAVEKPEETQQWLPWVHIVISNAKRFLLGTHHSVRYVQEYLAEFCWRFNRRHLNLFERLIHTALWYNPTSLPA